MIDPADVAVILLAAGRSERFGSDKLLAPLDGVPVALHAARRVAGLATGWRIVVCRADTPLDPEFAALGFERIVNPDPSLGLSSSLALGIARAAATGAKAALVALGDMPFVGPAHFAKLFSSFDHASAPIVASARNGVAMPPALFDRTYFQVLREGQGDSGARSLFAGAVLVAGDPDELADIDRPGDLP